MSKKILFIIIGVVLVITLGFGLYIWLSGSKLNSVTTSSSSPFGATGGNSLVAQGQQPSNSSNGSSATSTAGTDASGLREIASNPISGATTFSRASTTIVRYVDKATGNVYEYDVDANTTARITNTTMPKIDDVAWGDSGNTLVARFLKDSSIESYFGFFSTSTASTTDSSLAELVGNYMPENISSLSFSPQRDRIFYTVPGVNGIEAFVTDADGGNAKSVWQFPITEWIPQWITENTLALTTKASDGVLGDLFVLNLKTGAFLPTLSDIPGLTTLTNPDGSLILYSESQGSVTSLSIYNTENGQSQSTPFVTLPEKCTWKDATLYFCAVPKDGIEGNMPDAWYQGLTSFNDSIWQGSSADSGDVVTISKVINDLGSNSIDAISLMLSPDGNTLIFENKKDYSLWLLPIQQ